MAARPRIRSTDDSPLAGVDARTLDTPSQDVAPTDEDIRLEAALVERRQHSTTLADWSEANTRLQQGGGVEPPARAEEDEDEDEEEEDDDEDEDDEDAEEDEDDEDEDEDEEDVEETS